MALAVFYQLMCTHAYTVDVNDTKECAQIRTYTTAKHVYVPVYVCTCVCAFVILIIYADSHITSIT